MLKQKRSHFCDGFCGVVFRKKNGKQERGLRPKQTASMLGVSLKEGIQPKRNHNTTGMLREEMLSRGKEETCVLRVKAWRESGNGDIFSVRPAAPEEPDTSTQFCDSCRQSPQKGVHHVPSCHEARYWRCSCVNWSMVMFMVLSLRVAT